MMCISGVFSIYDGDLVNGLLRTPKESLVVGNS